MKAFKRNKPLSNRKGIILAGGLGKRLRPLTFSISKQLMPVYDKPMIYYPLSTLMLSGIKEILIITVKEDQNAFKRLLGDGQKWGMKFNYAVQDRPEGIPQAILIGKEFIGNSDIAIALGDNLFYGNDLISLLSSANSRKVGSTIFAYLVNDPERYGVVQFSNSRKVISIEEKPKKPLSKYAITGLYFYDNSVVERAQKLKFSDRKELEITALNNMYLEDELLNVEIMGRGFAWLDTGTFDSLHEAGSFIRTLENRQGLKVGCPEEIAWRLGWINDQDLKNLADPLTKSGYGKYLLKLLEGQKSLDGIS